MLIEFDTGPISEISGLCMWPVPGAVTLSVAVEDAMPTDGHHIEYGDDVADTFASCSVSVDWNSDPDPDADSLLRRLGRTFLADSVDVMGAVVTAATPPFPLPPDAPRTEWFTPDGMTFFEDVAVEDLDAYCAQLVAEGPLEPVPADIPIDRTSATPVICVGVTAGWFIMVTGPTYEGGSGLALTMLLEVLRGL